MNISSLLPSFVGTLDHVRSDICNFVITQASTESRHGILSVCDLGDDGLLGASTGEVLVQGLLFQGLLGHDHVLSASVASSAVGVEDLLTGSGISSESGLGGDHSGGTSGSGALGNLLE